MKTSPLWLAGQIVIQIVLIMLTLMYGLEYYEVKDRLPCDLKSSSLSSDCVPWGMTEGPMEGGSWNYENKEIYLKSLKALLAVFLLALIIPLVVPSRRIALVAMVLIVILGLSQLRWLVEFL